MRLILAQEPKDFYDLFDEVGLGEEFVKGVYRFCSKEYHEILWKMYICKIDSEPVGVCGIYADKRWPTSAWISWFGVRDQFRKQGCGTFMISEIEKEADSLGFSWLRVYTGKSNRTAIRFYKSKGMVATDEKVPEVGIPHIVMKKNLSLRLF
jgi:GNAT superfamily N-acetyltransferase